MRHLNSRKGLYLNIQGVAHPGSGLEIKERGKSEDDKPKLKGCGSGRGWHPSYEEAKAAEDVDSLLRAYQRRIMR